jgi:hypothetical protein
MNKPVITRIVTVLVLLGALSQADAQGTAFTYQGRLDSGGAPFTGQAESQATLWNALSGGVPGPLTLLPPSPCR